MKKYKVLSLITVIAFVITVFSQQLILKNQDNRLAIVERSLISMGKVVDLSAEIVTGLVFGLDDILTNVKKVLGDQFGYLSQITKTISVLVKCQTNLQEYVLKNVDPKPSLIKLRLATVEVRVGRIGGAGTLIKEEEDYLYVLTAKHVTECKGEVTVQLTDAESNSFLQVQNISRDNIYESDNLDMAIIKMPKPEGEFVTMPLADVRPKIGQTVYTMGHPINLGYTVQKGIVSNYTKRIFGGNKEEYMMISAPAFSGNSGGASINCYNQVVGIVVGIAYVEREVTSFQTTSIYLTHLVFVVPINAVNDFMEEVENETVNSD